MDTRVLFLTPLLASESSFHLAKVGGKAGLLGNTEVTTLLPPKDLQYGTSTTLHGINLSLAQGQEGASHPGKASETRAEMNPGTVPGHRTVDTPGLASSGSYSARI